MGSRTSLFAWLCAAMLVCTSPLLAQSPIVNPSFDDGLNGWTSYSYIPPDPGALEALPAAGSYVDFPLLMPPVVPEVTNMCGIQEYQTTGNGGVCQSFTWTGGPAAISAWGRAYSADYYDNPYDNGCRVRMGLVDFDTTDRGLVADWTVFPWSHDWSTCTILVPGPGTYALFLEAYQPNADAYMSTVWTNVSMWEQTPISITSGPTLTPDPANPQTQAIVTWTTDLPSASEVDYGRTTSYGSGVIVNESVTSHSVTITGLSHSTEYHYRVKSTSFAHIDAVSDDATFRTPIWISNVSAAISGDDSVDLTWDTDVPTGSQVEYWPQANGTHAYTGIDYTSVTSHHVTVTGLDKGVYYCFRAWSKQAGYTDASSAVQTVVILPPVSDSLENGTFDGNYTPEGPSLYPWAQYTATSPGFYPIDGIIGLYPKGGGATWSEAAIQAFDGSCFLGTQAYWGYKNGGVFQRVAVVPGQCYALNARYITRRIGGQDGYDLVRLGIDPDGGTDPASPNVTWWTGRSDTNDNQWQLAGVSAIAGSGGVATVFLDFYQRYSIEEHVAAIDCVTFATTQVTSIGALKSAVSGLGAILQNKIVTYAAPVTYGADQYLRAYVEEDNRSSGIAVLFPFGDPNCPVVGNRVTVAGALGVYNREAAVLAAPNWIVDTNVYPLPGAFIMSQATIGTSTLNQPPLFAKIAGLCNVGMRIRLLGAVTSVTSSGGDTVAYIDDGGGKIVDPSGNAGIMVRLPAKDGVTVNVGDHVDATGVLSITFVDPDGWPDPTDYYTYVLLCGSPDDWAIR